MTRIRTKALKDLRPGDKLALADPDGVGRVTSVSRPAWIKMATGPAIEVQWQTHGEEGWYIGASDDVVRLA